MTVSGSYLKLADRGDERASSRWFQALTHVPEFRRYQLVKHYLGLALEYGSGPLKLVYLYWESTNAATIALFAEHRAEIARLVAGDLTCSFKSLSYGEHWAELEAIGQRPSWLAGHLSQLGPIAHTNRPCGRRSPVGRTANRTISRVSTPARAA